MATDVAGYDSWMPLGTPGSVGAGWHGTEWRLRGAENLRPPPYSYSVADQRLAVIQLVTPEKPCE